METCTPTPHREGLSFKVDYAHAYIAGHTEELV